MHLTASRALYDGHTNNDHKTNYNTSKGPKKYHNTKNRMLLKFFYSHLKNTSPVKTGFYDLQSFA